MRALRPGTHAMKSDMPSRPPTAPVASIDLVEDDAGNVAVSIGHAPPLEGESLLALREQGAVALPTSPGSPPPVGSFLSAAGAAALLGVAKSTVTRKIERTR